MIGEILSKLFIINSLFCQESDNGLVQMIYTQLAVQRTSKGSPLFVFLDKQCLNYGQDWENGFLNGLQSAKVIALLMSNQVCR